MLSTDDYARLRQTELLFKTNLMGLQTNELIASSKLATNAIPHKAIKSFCDKLQSLPTVDISYTNLTSSHPDSFFSSLVARNNLLIPDSLHFTAPSSSDISSYFVAPSVLLLPNPTCYIDIKVPSSISTSRPFSKATWLVRRHVYLLHLMTSLFKYSPELVEVCGASTGIYNLKVHLNESNLTLIIKPVFASELFTLHSFLFDLENPNPILYNSICASLFRFEIHSDLDSFIDGFILFRTWLNRLGFGNCSVEFSVCVINHLIDQKLINQSHSSFQVFRILLNFIINNTNNDELKGFYEFENENVNQYSIDFSLFPQSFVVKFHSKSLFFNLLASFSAGFLTDLLSCARRSFEILQSIDDTDDSVLVFSSLFLTDYRALDRFGTIIQFNSFDFEKFIPRIEQILNISIPNDCDLYMISFYIRLILATVFGPKVSSIRVDFDPSKSQFIIYIERNPIEQVSQLFTGPLNNDPDFEAKGRSFTLLFGKDKVNLRKLRNGDVRLAIVFNSTLSSIIVDVVKYILNLHFCLSKLRVSAVPFSKALNLASVDNQSNQIKMIVDQFSSDILSLELPLSILEVNCTDSRYYGSFIGNDFDFFPCPVSISIVFESISTWPKTLEGLTRFKQAMLVELFEQLNLGDQNSSINQKGKGYCTVGGIFLSLDVTHVNDPFRISDDLFPNNSSLICHSLFIKSFSDSFPCFRDCLGVTQQFFSKLSMSSLFDSYIIELLTACVFSNDVAELVVDRDFVSFSSDHTRLPTKQSHFPSTQAQYFIRLLRFLSSWTSNTITLVIKPSDSSTLDSQVFPVLCYESTNQSPLVISTPYDPKGVYWTRHSGIRTRDLRFVSATSSKFLKIIGSEPSNLLLRSILFNRIKTSYNLELTLKSLKDIVDGLSLESKFKNLGSSLLLHQRTFVDFNPYTLFIETLQNDDFLKNYISIYCGNNTDFNSKFKIGILFNDCVFKPAQLQVSNLRCLVPISGLKVNEKAAGVVNVLVIIERIKQLGKGLVENLVVL
ncbi:hypothetical protein P9112_002417 [Eukaryota sp. TZLM1-RC]